MENHHGAKSSFPIASNAKRLLTSALLTAALPSLSAYAFQSRSVVSDSAGVRIVYATPADNPAVCPVSDEPVLSIGSDDDLEYLFYLANHLVELFDGRIAVLDGCTNAPLASCRRYSAKAGEKS